MGRYGKGSAMDDDEYVDVWAWLIYCWLKGIMER